MKSALELLRQLREAEPAVEQILAPNEAKEREPSLAEASQCAFACSGLTVHCFSGVLGENVTVSADNADMDLWLMDHPEAFGTVVYRTREIAALRGVSPGGLRLLHEVKKAFGGDIELDDSCIVNDATY